MYACPSTIVGTVNFTAGPNSTGTPILRKNLQCYRRFLLPEFRDSSTIPPSFHRLSLLASERLLEADLLVIGFLLIFPVWERLLA